MGMGLALASGIQTEDPILEFHALNLLFDSLLKLHLVQAHARD